jgi:hypothetical protein
MIKIKPMTIEQRLEQVEQQNQKIQRTNKRLTVALTMMAVVVCAVVTMAATGDKDGVFDTVKARHILVTNGAGDIVVSLGANDGGAGVVWTHNSSGKVLINLGVDDGGDGLVSNYSATAEENGPTDGLVDLTSTKDLNGSVYKIARGGWLVLQFGKFARWIF